MAFPLTSIVPPSSSFPPRRARTWCSDSEGASCSKPWAQQSLTSKDSPPRLLLFTPAKNEVIKEARTYLFSPGYTGEAQLNKHPVFLQPACPGVPLQVAKSSAKCSECHTLHPLPIPRFIRAKGHSWSFLCCRGWLSLLLSQDMPWDEGMQQRWFHTGCFVHCQSSLPLHSHLSPSVMATLFFP